MPITHKYKSIFVHIPKTGGTSIEKILNIPLLDNNYLRSHTIFNINNVEYAPQHFTSKILKEHDLVKPYWNTYFKFSIVRHPYNRVLSEYFWNTKSNNFDIMQYRKWFNDYYANINTDHKLSQYDYLYINGNLAVDYVGKFEELLKTFSYIKNKLSIKQDLPHIQKSKNKSTYLNQLTKVDKAKIFNLFEKDFLYFNYLYE